MGCFEFLVFLIFSFVIIVLTFFAVFIVSLLILFLLENVKEKIHLSILCNTKTKIFRKIFYIIKQRYNPYPLYWFDLLTERKLKYRKGECIDCIECCKFNCDCQREGNCYCKHVDLQNKRCTVFEIATCDIWFPISQKEIDYMKSIKKDFNCKYKFEK